MARKEIKIFMDAKEAASFLKTIDWSWLFGFLSERYNVSLSLLVSQARHVRFVLQGNRGIR